MNMNKLLLIIAFLSIGGMLSAQQLVLTPNDSSTNNQQVTSPFDIVQMNAYVKNVSGSDTNVFWEVESVTAPMDWETQFCDKYTCIDISVLPNSSFDLANNDSSTMKGQVIPSCVSGTGVLRVKMWIEGDTSSAILGTYISEVTVDTSPCKVSTGLTTILGDEGNLVVHPNPANNQVFVSLNSNSTSLQATIFDVNGRLVEQMEISNNSDISINQLQTGFYILKVLDIEAGAIYTKKIMKQ
jgi:hypothetical protein